MTVQLSHGQANIVSLACKGHNLFVTGQGGTGKSTVVREIISNLQAVGKRVSVVCSTGIACTVYDPGVASTVNSYYGVGIADLPWRQLVERSTKRSGDVDRIKRCNVLIWDEANMSSQRMLELVNAIHHRLSEPHCNRPFAGKQVILVGEFLQLRPVPNVLDEGLFMFHSPVFQSAITHRYELTDVLRQRHEEFLIALKDIRFGKCSEKTREFITSLSRSLQSVQDDLSHIYFKRLLVALHNRLALKNLPLPQFTFEAENTNLIKGMNWPGSSILHLRPGCPVMLVWNLNNELKNGSRGVFEECVGDTLKVSFPGVCSILIEKQTWFKRNKEGKIVGSIRQFPIVLAYAITCHKSQGLTLSAAVVHCSSEFVLGLTYVALSRVRDPANLQVLNFRSTNLLPPSSRVIRECSTDLGQIEEDLRCCRNKELCEDFFEVKDKYAIEEKDCDETFNFPSELNDGLVASYFERADDEPVIDLVQVYGELSKPDSELSSPPPSIAVSEMLASMRVDKPLSVFAKDKNTCIQQLQEVLHDKATAFVNLTWFHLYEIFNDHIIENPDEVIVNISRGGFTECTAKLHQFLNSPQFQQYIKALFNCTEVSPPLIAAATEIATKLYEEFLGQLVLVISRRSEEERQEPIRFDVSEMTGPGKAKIRHVGGWAIRATLESEKRYARENMQTKDPRTLKKVKESVIKCELIEETLLVPYVNLKETTSHPETLELTEARQFRERGLVHISDPCFAVFIHMEQLRVDLMNSAKLRQFKQDMVTNAHEEIAKNKNLQSLWRACFSSKDVSERKVIESYLCSVLLSHGYTIVRNNPDPY